MQKAKYQKIETAVKNLKIGDLILVHTYRDNISKLIRFTTQSYWEHVALVFDVPHKIGDGEASIDEVLIVEALPGANLSVHRLQTYLNNKDIYSLGIKRMKGLNELEREKFRGYFLEALDTPYDVTIVYSMFFQRLKLWLINMSVTFKEAYQLSRSAQYMCTTFAQKSFYLAVAPNKRSNVIFREKEKVGFLRKMTEITPADIAASENTIWLYNRHK